MTTYMHIIIIILYMHAVLCGNLYSIYIVESGPWGRGYVIYYRQQHYNSCAIQV